MTDNHQIVPRIEVRDVSLAFDDQVVLDHVSFTVAPGEMKLMLGESGGGKSMILKVAPWGEKAKIEDEGDKFCLISTKVVMLHHGRIIFEGTDEQFWHSSDPFIREFLEFDITAHERLDGKAA